MNRVSELRADQFDLEQLILLAEQGNAEAQYNLGLMYTRGEGVTEDAEEAVKLLGMAGEQGLACAQFGLGLIYARGMGVQADNILAYMLMNISFICGYEEAQKYKRVLARRMTKWEFTRANELARKWVESHDSLFW